MTFDRIILAIAAALLLGGSILIDGPSESDMEQAVAADLQDAKAAAARDAKRVSAELAK
jgi:hypothetical protein